MTKKINELKKELSEVTDKIETMIEKGTSETDPKLDKLNTRQHQLEIDLDFQTNVMSEAKAVASFGLSRDDFTDTGEDLEELKEIVEGGK